jgi:hypothetical protein
MTSLLVSAQLGGGSITGMHITKVPSETASIFAAAGRDDKSLASPGRSAASFQNDRSTIACFTFQSMTILAGIPGSKLPFFPGCFILRSGNLAFAIR